MDDDYEGIANVHEGWNEGLDDFDDDESTSWSAFEEGERLANDEMVEGWSIEE